MADVALIITTFNRSEPLKIVLRHLKAEAVAKRIRCRVLLQDDASDFRFHPIKDIANRFRVGEYFEIEYFRSDSNRGLKKHWMMWNGMVQTLVHWGFSIAISLPDDHVPCENFIERVNDKFREVRSEDPGVVAMNLLVNYTRCWGKNRYVDGAFVATKQFFEAFGWQIKAPSCERRSAWVKGKPMSSGVGDYMSRKLGRHKEYRIARAEKMSFLNRMETESVMYPEASYPARAKRLRTYTKYYVDREKTCYSD